MKNKIELNGEKYVLESSIKKKEMKLKDYFILEQANVMAIVPNKESIEDTFCIEDIGDFREFVGEMKIITDIKSLSNLNKIEVIKFSETKYSKEYIDKAIKTSKAFLGVTTPRIFLVWNETKEEFVEDNPCLLVFDNMVFCLAPRIESED